MESWYVMYYLQKITNMAYQGFREKLFKKMALSRSLLGFLPSWAWFVQFLYQNLEYFPHFCKDVHLYILNNFWN
jgi:hypothetical protein